MNLSELTNSDGRIGGLSGLQSLTSVSLKTSALRSPTAYSMYREFIPHSSRTDEGGDGNLEDWYQSFHPSTRLHPGQSLCVGVTNFCLGIEFVYMTHADDACRSHNKPWQTLQVFTGSHGTHPNQSAVG